MLLLKVRRKIVTFAFDDDDRDDDDDDIVHR